jgi:hypothetical protein
LTLAQQAGTSEEAAAQHGGAEVVAVAGTVTGHLGQAGKEAIGAAEEPVLQQHGTMDEGTRLTPTSDKHVRIAIA